MIIDARRMATEACVIRRPSQIRPATTTAITAIHSSMMNALIEVRLTPALSRGAQVHCCAVGSSALLGTDFFRRAKTPSRRAEFRTHSSEAG